MASLFSGDYTADPTQAESLTVTVANVLNANVTAPSASFYIATKYDSEGFDVDDSTGLNVSYSGTRGAIDFSTTSVTVVNPTVGATSSYDIEFRATNGLYRLSYVVLELP